MEIPSPLISTISLPINRHKISNQIEMTTNSKINKNNTNHRKKNGYFAGKFFKLSEIDGLEKNITATHKDKKAL
jgi:hypothetical protein